MHKRDNKSFARPKVHGKFLLLGEEKFYIKGVTYGTFAPQENGAQFPEYQQIREDFRLMRAKGINCVRTYTVPSREVLKAADEFGLKIMAGLPWEQHITFLDDPKRIKDIIRRTKEGVLSCLGHQSILCYAIGNEIPAPIVRWHGKSKIEQFLHALYQAVKAIDPEGLVTYVNYPTTEYLDLSFLDFQCFNVYLETPQKLERYLARLHSLIGDTPLVLAEIGLDSMRNGADRQASVLEWQIEKVFGTGSAGMFVFAWTDEWWRGGFEIEDWDFGLVRRDRSPKPALEVVKCGFAKVPLTRQEDLPKISVVVCSYNGAPTIEDTMEGLLTLEYPDYEVIVVNDGSKDRTPEIVGRYPFTLINTENRGLSNARNTGLQAASGEIVAYIDDDAYPDPHWLQYLAYAYRNHDFGAVGGPNLAPRGDGPIAECVANAPGGPVHVLVSDTLAEHIPGCNMSFRKSALLEAGGFDPVYRAAGDDVDACWKVLDKGYQIGFHPSAFVWHHRRNSVKAYWKQQKGYGKAEALLEQKWPEKYNSFGHLAWAGRIYGNGLTVPIKWSGDKIFHGTWGTALFQSVYQKADGFWASLPLMPEWYMFIALVGTLSFLGFLWSPLLLVWPLFMLAVSVVVLQAATSARRAIYASRPSSRRRKFKFWALTTVLHIVQPIARLIGRIKHGLVPWRKRGLRISKMGDLSFAGKVLCIWSENWQPVEDWLTALENNILQKGVRVKRGGHYDRWDLQVKTGMFSTAKSLLTIEEHGSGKQYLKLLIWPTYSKTGLCLILGLAVLTLFALLDQAYPVAAFTGLLTLLTLHKFLVDTQRACHNLNSSFLEMDGDFSSDEEQDQDLKSDERAPEAEAFERTLEKPAYSFNFSAKTDI